MGSSLIAKKFPGMESSNKSVYVCCGLTPVLSSPVPDVDGLCSSEVGQGLIVCSVALLRIHARPLRMVRECPQ